MMKTPQDYELPHKEWRPHQLAVTQVLLEIRQGDVQLLEAPTGSGKTALARAVGSQHSVTTLCRTKMLQQENYADGYGFDTLFGRGNYICALEPLLTGAECEYAEVGMKECPEVENCAYLQQKALVMGSNLRALNYAYWLTAKWPRLAATDFVVCDEAHLLSDIVLDFTGITLTEKQRKEWELPAFPTINSHSGSILTQSNPVADAIAWLENARVVLLQAYYALDKQKGSKDRMVLKRLRQCERLGLKVRNALDALKHSGSDWYIKAGEAARKVSRGDSTGFVCRPLTARHHAPSYFLDGWRTVMMSATIGEPDAFSRELGIKEYQQTVIPSVWPPETRPVLVPANAPKMGRATTKKGPAAYDEQARIVLKLIKSVPPTWSGVIHHTSIKEAQALMGRLSRGGLAGRLWSPPQGVGTEEQFAAWNEQKAVKPNSIAVTWSWHAGVDLLDERICIVAKVQFPYLGDDYERARLSFDGKFYLQRTAWALEQACGRTRRGREQDYDTTDERRGLVAIVDGNWVRVQKYLSPAFRESLVKV